MLRNSLTRNFPLRRLLLPPLHQILHLKQNPLKQHPLNSLSSQLRIRLPPTIFKLPHLSLIPLRLPLKNLSLKTKKKPKFSLLSSTELLRLSVRRRKIPTPSMSNLLSALLCLL